MALHATIQAMGRGSGVMVSKTNVLNQVFSTAQAIWPVMARAAIMTQARVLIRKADNDVIDYFLKSMF